MSITTALDFLKNEIEKKTSCMTTIGTVDLQNNPEGSLNIFLVPISSPQTRKSLEDNNIVKYLILDVIVKTKMTYLEAFAEAENIMDLLPELDYNDSIIEITTYSPQEVRLECGVQTFKVRADLKINK